MKLMKFLEWLQTHLPHAIVIVLAMVLIGAGFYIMATPAGPIVSSVVVGLFQFKYLYGLTLIGVGGFAIFALARRSIPLFLKANTLIIFTFGFLCVTRLVTVGFTPLTWWYLLAFVMIAFLCRMVIWYQWKS